MGVRELRDRVSMGWLWDSLPGSAVIESHREPVPELLPLVVALADGEDWRGGRPDGGSLVGQDLGVGALDRVSRARPARAVSFSKRARRNRAAASLQDSPANGSPPRTALCFILGYTAPRPWRSGGQMGRCNLAWDGAQRSPRSGDSAS